MSFGGNLNISGIFQALILALMLVTVFALFYFDIDITYKIGIGALSFTLMFLAMIANEILRQQREALKEARK